MGLKRNISKLIPVGTELVCACNSGAKVLKVIGFKGMQGTKKRRLSGGVGDVAVVSVKVGKQELKKKVLYALVVRQKYPYLRKTGVYLGRVAFKDNAAILLDEKLKLRKTTIKGVVAKEVAEINMYSQISATLR